MDLSTKNIFRVLAAVTVFLLLLFAIYKVGWVFGWLAAALLITTLLSPITGFLQKYMPKKSRGLAVFATFIVILAVFVFLAMIIFPPIIKEFMALAEQVASWVSEAKADPRLQDVVLEVQNNKTQINAGGAYSVVNGVFGYLSGSLKGLVSSVSSFVFAMITIVTLTFFMLLDTESVTNGISYYLPTKHQSMFKRLSNDLFTLISKYFGGVLVVGIIAGVAAYIPLWFLNVPYASALALTVAVFDLIPMVGATIGGAIVVLVCLMSGNIPAAVIMTIYFVIYQQLENNLIIPLVQKQAVKISPLGILVALLIGGALAGIVGTLLAIPAAAFIKIVYETLKKQGTLGGKAAESVTK